MQRLIRKGRGAKTRRMLRAPWKNLVVAAGFAVLSVALMGASCGGKKPSGPEGDSTAGKPDADPARIAGPETGGAVGLAGPGWAAAVPGLPGRQAVAGSGRAAGFRNRMLIISTTTAKAMAA